MSTRKEGYYWVKTNGYGIKHQPFYFNGKSWKVTINDSDQFISEHQMKQLFGKESILRPINEETDLCQNAKGDGLFNYFYPVLVKSDNGEDIVFIMHPLLNMIFHNGMLVPLKEHLGFLVFNEGENDDE